MKTKMETKDILDFKFTMPDEGADQGAFKGYASIFGVVDSYGDIVEKGAFKRTLKNKQMFPLLWSHNIAQPIGVISAKEDQTGLKVEGQLNLDVQLGREIRSLMKQGAVKGLSIGYQTVKEEPDQERNARLLKEINLWEISTVVFQACPDALAADIKSEELIGDEALEPDEGKPYPNNHDCIIDESLKVVGSMKRKHEGKEYTVRIGKKADGGTGDHSYLYPKDTWTEAEARAHCKDHGGRFEAAKCADCAHDDKEALPQDSGQPTPGENPQLISNSERCLHLLDSLRLKF